MPADTPRCRRQKARRVLSLAHEEAERLHHNYIGTEHLLLGLIREEGGVAGRVLRELGLEAARVKEMVERLSGQGRYAGGRIELAPGTEQVRRQTRRILQESPARRPPAQTAGAPPREQQPKTPLVDQLATDLTAKAEEGKLDPVIGREMEIERVIQILARRGKNNPALIGET